MQAIIDAILRQIENIRARLERLETRETTSAAYTLNGIAVFSFDGSLLAATGKLRLYNQTGRSVTISEVYCACSTAPTTNAIIVDIHKGGVTIFTNQAHRPEIAAAANAGNSTTIDVATWADGEYLTCNLDQVGVAGGTGSDLTVHVVFS